MLWIKHSSSSCSSCRRHGALTGWCGVTSILPSQGGQLRPFCPSEQPHLSAAHLRSYFSVFTPQEARSVVTFPAPGHDIDLQRPKMAVSLAAVSFRTWE